MIETIKKKMNIKSLKVNDTDQYLSYRIELIMMPTSLISSSLFSYSFISVGMNVLFTNVHTVVVSPHWVLMMIIKPSPPTINYDCQIPKAS